MKQYTNESQTAKLIELGFEKPRIDAGVTKWEGYEPICTGSYTLGELIEMLPPKVGEWNLSIERYWETERWCVSYDCGCFSMTTELIEALYDMCINLKEKGVI